MNSKILIVDDDQKILSGYKRHLRKAYDVETVTEGETALRMMAERGPFAVIISDMQMPGMNGIQLLSKAKNYDPDSVRIMLTGYADLETAIEAVNEGSLFRILTKPCPPETMIKALAAGVEQYRLVTAERELLEKTLRGSIKILTEILSLFDPDLFGRGMKIRDLIFKIGKTLKMPITWEIETSAMLSQIGNVSIPPEITMKFKKGYPLLKKEMAMFHHIPEVGGCLLANIPRLENVSNIILYQNKRFDGMGFPLDSVGGENIPWGARLIKVLSDLLEVESDGTSRHKALQTLQQRRGWYDPKILEKVLSVFGTSSRYVNSPREIKVNELPDVEWPSTSLSFAELQPDHILVSDIKSIDGYLLLAAGHRITTANLQRLRNCADLRGVREPIEVEDLS